jgi:hypothetical protein
MIREIAGAGGTGTQIFGKAVIVGQLTLLEITYLDSFIV